MSPSNVHVVFGAGQIGTPLARLLASRGREVRVVRRRSGRAQQDPPTIVGDAMDPGFATEACRDAAVVYHCMNPAYDARTWARELPRLADSLVAACRANGARLVVLDNLYMHGVPRGPISEDTPEAPTTKKGAIRAAVARRFFEAHSRGDVRVVVGRASDFYGPGGEASHFGPSFWPDAIAKGSGPVLINPDTPHAYTFTLDVVSALAALGEAPDDACGRWWALPTATAEPTRALVARFSNALGREIRIRRMPALARRAAGLFVPVLRELEEMLPGWDAPYALDDRRFRARFGLSPTPPDDGARLTVEWARERFAKRG